MMMLLAATDCETRVHSYTLSAYSDRCICGSGETPSEFVPVDYSDRILYQCGELSWDHVTVSHVYANGHG
jgi:hypothetical protein